MAERDTDDGLLRGFTGRDIDRLERLAREILSVIAASRARGKTGRKGRAAAAPVKGKRGRRSAVEAASQTPKKRGRPFNVATAHAKLGPSDVPLFEDLRGKRRVPEIATESQLSLSTVRNRSMRIFKRLGVKSREELQQRYPAAAKGE